MFMGLHRPRECMKFEQPYLSRSAILSTIEIKSLFISEIEATMCYIHSILTTFTMFVIFLLLGVC